MNINWPDDTDGAREAVAREAVARGLAYLDHHYPGWRGRLIPGWQSGSSATCPLAAATGNFDRALRGRVEWAEWHGFMRVPPTVDSPGCLYSDLDQAWSAALKGTAPPPVTRYLRA
jgi:hypothetical protein